MTIFMSNIPSVQDIFRNVDDAFKKRKVYNQQLQLEVSDLENQLEYLINQTQQQSDVNTNYNITSSISKSNTLKLQRDFNDIHHVSIENLKDFYDELRDCIMNCKYYIYIYYIYNKVSHKYI